MHAFYSCKVWELKRFYILWKMQKLCLLSRPIQICEKPVCLIETYTFCIEKWIFSLYSMLNRSIQKFFYPVCLIETVRLIETTEYVRSGTKVGCVSALYLLQQWLSHNCLEIESILVRFAFWKNDTDEN